MNKVETAARSNLVQYYKNNGYPDMDKREAFIEGFSKGAEWQRKQFSWISVNERLPKYSEKVLVLFECKGKPVIQVDYYLGENDGDSEWKFEDSKILAWMYIPSINNLLNN